MIKYAVSFNRKVDNREGDGTNMCTRPHIHVRAKTIAQWKVDKRFYCNSMVGRTYDTKTKRVIFF